MALNLTPPDISELKPRITVFGVGGAGGNAAVSYTHLTLPTNREV